MGPGSNTVLRPPRCLLLCSVSLIALSGSALAADLPVVKVTPALAASWAGFYLGVHGGYGWGRDDFSQSEAFALATPQSVNGIRGKGAVYGAQAGYNWQFGRAVTGLEFDFSATDIKGSNAVSQLLGGTDATTITLSEKAQYLGSVRSRLGWLPADNVLLYGTAGLAWERLDSTSQTLQTSTAPVSATLSSSRTPTDRFGWVAGAGVEAMLGSPNWIGRIEYLHYDFGHIADSSAITAAIGQVNSTSGSQTIDLVRAGVSYKFGEQARLAPVPYVKAPVMASARNGWAGFYAGAHGGYGWGDDPATLPLPLLDFAPDGALTGAKSQGWVAGGQFGHNWQYDRVVAGLEADLSAADIKGSTSTASIAVPGFASTLKFDEKVKYLGTVRGRLGWTPIDTLLLYGTAGLGWERLEISQVQQDTTATGVTTTRTATPSDRFGWVAGVGGEMMLGSSNWIGRLEYLHYDFGRVRSDSSLVSVSPPLANFAAATAIGHQTVDLVRAGVSYKFGPDAALPVSALAYAKAGPPPSLQSWSGFYLGAHGGYGWKQNDFSDASLLGGVTIGDIKSKGWLGGGQAGYNWQYASVVAGVEIDGSATGIKGSTPTVLAGTISDTLSDNVKYLGTLRGRLGWTPSSGWLLYATGGLAFERAHRIDSSANSAPSPVTAAVIETARNHFGMAAGAGVETFLGNSNWIGRIEYLHYDFGTVEATSTITTTEPGGMPTRDRGGRQTIDTVRAGLSYKFTP
jgi:opacity protein-like surface antigen